MKPSITTLTRVAVALSACLVFVATHDGAVARDRGYDGGGFVVRDHRSHPWSAIIARPWSSEIIGHNLLSETIALLRSCGITECHEALRVE